jgi:hypothetical protein
VPGWEEPQVSLPELPEWPGRSREARRATAAWQGSPVVPAWLAMREREE